MRSESTARVLALSLCLSALVGGAFPDSLAQERTPAPIPDPAKGRMTSYNEVSAAYAKQDWTAVLAAAAPILDSEVRDEVLAWTLYMTSTAEYPLGRYEDCVAHANTYLEEMAEHAYREQGYTPQVQIARLLSLGVLRREEDARSACRAFPQENPGSQMGIIAAGLKVALGFKGRTAVEPEYTGKYLADPRLADARKRLEVAIPAAESRVRRRLESAELVIPSCAIGIVDGESLPGEDMMSTQYFRVGKTRIPVVLARSEYLVTREVDEERILAHEMVHVLHLAVETRVESPRWLFEGVAQWVADEEGTGLRVLVVEQAVSGRSQGSQGPATLLSDLDSLDGADLRLQAFCGALILYHVEAVRGVGDARRLATRLIREPDWRAILQEETRANVGEFLRQVRDWYGPWASKTFAPLQGAVNGALAEAKEMRFKEAVQSLEEYLKVTRDEVERPPVEFQIEEILRASGDCKAALARIQGFRSMWPRSSLASSAALLELTLLRESSRWSEVANLARTWSKDYAWRIPESRREVEGMRVEAEAHLHPPDGKKEPDPAPSKPDPK